MLILIRHAPVIKADRLCGRTDLPARIDPDAIKTLADRLPPIGAVVSSPAQRCMATARALFPDQGIETDPRLWEQDFGQHDGMLYGDLPDLGVMNSQELAQYRPPNGESFADLCTRVAPALHALSDRALSVETPIVASVHAGVIRAALALVLGAPACGMPFEVANLSTTRLRCGPDGPVSITEVNHR